MQFREQHVLDVNGDTADITDDEQIARELQEEEEARVQQRSRRRTQRIASNIPKAEPSFRCLGVRGKSYKKYRRYENGMRPIARFRWRLEGYK